MEKGQGAAGGLIPCHSLLDLVLAQREHLHHCGLTLLPLPLLLLLLLPLLPLGLGPRSRRRCTGGEKNKLGKQGHMGART